METFESFDNTLQNLIFATSVQEGRDLNDAWRLEAENVSPEVRSELQAFGQKFIDFMVSTYGKMLTFDVYAAQEALQNITIADPTETNIIESELYSNKTVDDLEFAVRSAFLKTNTKFHPAIAEFFTVILGVDPMIGPFAKGDPHILRRYQELVLAHELTHALIPASKFPLKLKEAIAEYYALSYFDQADADHNLVLEFGTDEEGFEKLRESGLPVKSVFKYLFARGKDPVQLVKGWGKKRYIVYSLKEHYLTQHYGTNKNMVVGTYVKEFDAIIKTVGHGFVKYILDPTDPSISERQKEKYRVILNEVYEVSMHLIDEIEAAPPKKPAPKGV